MLKEEIEKCHIMFDNDNDHSVLTILESWKFGIFRKVNDKT